MFLVIFLYAMSYLKIRTIFISHAWLYDRHYWQLVRWFDKTPYFLWKNCSIPSHNSLPDKTTSGLRRGMTRQIRPAQVVILLGGMYSAHSDWIRYEILEAQRMNKLIIGVRPWAQQRVPLIVQQASSFPVVNWNRASIIQAIRRYV